MTEPKETQSRPARAPRPAKWKVRRVDLDHPEHVGAVVGSHDTEAQARHYVRTNHPRGREVFVESPTGTREHYSADLDHMGEDPWSELDPEEVER